MKRIVRYILNRVPRKTIQRFVPNLKHIAHFFYAGNSVCCPICGHSYRKFLPYGYVHTRDNALCPSCMSLERHRLLWLYIERETDLLSAHYKMLHIAPEKCYMDRFTEAMGTDYITADLESPLARIKLDIQNIQYPDCSFDVIFCNHILEHVGDDRKAIGELYRVMRYGGWGIVLSPINTNRATTYEDPAIVTPADRSRAYGQHDHLRDYGLDFPDRLRDAGFEVECIDYSAQLTADERKRYGLRNDTIFRVTKPIKEQQAQ